MGIRVGQVCTIKDGQVEALEGIILDITNRKKMENHLRYLSNHDKFTGLYNRAFLDMTLERDIAEKKDVKKALMVINLSSTHVLTANYGYNYTLKIIKKAAESLEQFINKNCDLFRIFENRFILYVRNYKHKDDLINLSRQLLKQLDSVLKPKESELVLALWN